MDVKFDICFTSPLTRARQTARLVLGGRDIPVIPDKRIQEINFGGSGRAHYENWKYYGVQLQRI